LGALVAHGLFMPEVEFREGIRIARDGIMHVDSIELVTAAHAFLVLRTPGLHRDILPLVSSPQ
jgi:hypothetical protein